MKKEFPFYVKSGKEIVEVFEDKWTSISMDIIEEMKSYAFLVHRRFEKITEASYWEESWMHLPEKQSTKQEFDSLKIEFLNWVDENLKR